MSSAYVLELGGCPYVFHGGGRYPSLSDGRAALDCIEPLEPLEYQSRMPEVGGVADPAQAEVVLNDRGGVLEALFSRQPEGVTRTTLGAKLTYAEDTTLTADSDISGFPASGRLHLHLETLEYDSKDDEARTFSLTARGAWGSQRVVHSLDTPSRNAFKPLITLHPTLWRKRRATLRLCELDATGEIQLPGHVLVDGFLQETPYSESPGKYVVAVVDELAKMERTLGSSGRTGLARYIYLGERAARLPLREQLGPGMYFAHNADYDAVAQTLTCDVSDHYELFGRDLGDLSGDVWQARLTVQQPANVRTPEVQRGGLVGSYLLDGGGNRIGFNLASALGINDIEEGFLWVSSEMTEDDPLIDIPEGLYQWPLGVLEALDGQLESGHADGRFRYLIVGISADGRNVRVTGRFPLNDIPGTPETIYWREAALLFDARRREDSFWFPFFWSSEEGVTLGTEGLYRDPSDRAGRTGQTRRMGTDRLAHPSAPLPLAMWFPYMDYIMLKEAPLGQVGRLAMRRHDGVTVYVPYSEVVAQFDDDAELVGYRVRVDYDAVRDKSELLAVADWEGEEPTVVYAAPDFSGRTLHEVLLEVLLSGFSDETQEPHARSKQPRAYGLRVDADLVDIEGILSVPLPLAFMDMSDFSVADGATATEAIGQWYKAIGYSLVMASVGGSRRITLRPTSRILPHDGPALSTSYWYNFAKDRLPARARGAERAAAYRFETNFDPVESEFLSDTLFVDADAVDAEAGDRTEEAQFALRGLNLANETGFAAPEDLAHTESVLFDLFKRLRATGGRIHPRLSGSLPWSVAKDLYPGAQFSFQGRDVMNIDGETVVSGPVHVVETTHRPGDSTVDVTFSHSFARMARWAPVLTVESVDGDEVTFEEHAWAVETLGDLEVNDLYFWADGGEAVDVSCVGVKVGEDEDTDNEALTMSGADWAARTATLAGHTLSPGDRVRPANYSASPPHFVTVYVFMSLGGSIVEGVAGFYYA